MQHRREACGPSTRPEVLIDVAIAVLAADGDAPEEREDRGEEGTSDSEDKENERPEKRCSDPRDSSSNAASTRMDSVSPSPVLATLPKCAPDRLQHRSSVQAALGGTREQLKQGK